MDNGVGNTDEKAIEAAVNFINKVRERRFQNLDDAAVEAENLLIKNYGLKIHYNFLRQIGRLKKF